MHRQNIYQEKTHMTTEVCAAVLFGWISQYNNPSSTGHSYTPVMFSIYFWAKQQWCTHRICSLPCSKPATFFKSPGRKRGKLMHVITFPPCLPASQRKVLNSVSAACSQLSENWSQLTPGTLSHTSLAVEINISLELARPTPVLA